MKVLLAIFIAFFSTFTLAKSDYLFIEGKFDPTARWTSFSQSEELNVKNLIQHLSKAPSGRALLLEARKKARTQGLTLLDVIKPGSGSLTDTTLIRRFSPERPDRVAYETRSVVYVNRSLNQYDALLDLAHELTHFVYRGEFNPYQLDFSLDDFIKSTIEGQGGEAQAFVKECEVLGELFPSKRRAHQGCSEVTDKDGRISQELVVKKFYQIGPYKDPFKKILRQEGVLEKFPDLSSQEVSFVSSAYGVPYPVAAYKEFKAVMGKVCENDKRRLAYANEASGRSPASVADASSDWQRKCASFY